jgi:hypothetical protein
MNGQTIRNFPALTACAALSVLCWLSAVLALVAIKLSEPRRGLMLLERDSTSLMPLSPNTTQPLLSQEAGTRETKREDSGEHVKSLQRDKVHITLMLTCELITLNCKMSM